MFRCLCLYIIALAVCTANANAADLNIVTGASTGTYIQVGESIKKLVARYGIEMDVQPSAGSMENVEAVFKRPNTQLGIVQGDVLEFIKYDLGNPDMKRIGRNIKIVFPLYKEEIHIVAHADLAKLSDLEGKRVVVGERGSGTYLTAKLILRQTGVHPAEELNIGADPGIEAMRQGRADAVFYVAGQPTRLFLEKVTSADNFHLLPITEKSVLAYYQSSRIPPRAYPWQASEVPVASVQAILMTYEYGKSNEYRRRSCAAVGKIARIISDNMDWLKEHGHPKWQQVNIDTPVKGWEQGRCVKEGLNRSSPPAAIPSASGTSACLQACRSDPNVVSRRACEHLCQD